MKRILISAGVLTCFLIIGGVFAFNGLTEEDAEISGAMADELEAAEVVYMEASQLDAEGKLNAEKEAELGEEFNKHIFAVRQEIANLEAVGRNDEAATVRIALRMKLSGFTQYFQGVANGASVTDVSDTN